MYCICPHCLFCKLRCEFYFLLPTPHLVCLVALLVAVHRALCNHWFYKRYINFITITHFINDLCQ